MNQLACVRCAGSIACLLIAACGSGRDLVPRVFPDNSPRALVDASTAVVIGSVTKVRKVSGKHRSFGDQQLELTEINVTSDASIKGTISSDKLTFYRYDCVENCRNGDIASSLQVGGRYVLLLVNDGPHLRSTQDVYASSFPVAQAGRLSGVEGDDTRHLVARSVLQSGSHADALELSRTLFTRRGISNDLVGRNKTIQLLKPLLRDPTPDLRREACFALAEAMYDFQGCLARLAADTSATETERNRARRRLNALETLQTQLHSVFMKDPERWLGATAGTEDRQNIRDLLELLSEHPDAAVRAQALRILRGYPAKAK